MLYHIQQVKDSFTERVYKKALIVSEISVVRFLHIQKASPKDISFIVRIHKACVRTINTRVYSQSHVRVWLRQISAKKVQKQFKSSKWIVLRYDHKVIGFAQYSISNKTLYQINIAPRYMHGGYGRMLYEYIEKDFRKHQVKSIILNATLNAVEFYKALGFKRIKNIVFKLGTSCIKIILMQKRLRAY